MHTKTAVSLLLTVLALIIVSGCSRDVEKQGPETPKPAASAAEQPGERPPASREDFEKYAGARLDELQARLAELKAEAEKKGQAFAKEHDAQLKRLEDQIKVEKARLEVLKKSGKEAWADLREGFDLALSDLEKAFKEAADEFKK